MKCCLFYMKGNDINLFGYVYVWYRMMFFFDLIYCNVLLLFNIILCGKLWREKNVNVNNVNKIYG